MDCCNYVPYKSNYYGVPRYFDQTPQYHVATEYYNPPYPPEFCGNTPYYASHSWQCGVTPFADYVYNPKEARIRKAMRDANRERAMGMAPSTRVTRRTQPWVLSEQDDQFMMAASHGMRSVALPMCGNGFPIGGNGASGQFMGPTHSYNKHIHHAPHNHQPYLQSNLMTQLQHQAEMWHYHDNTSSLRPQLVDQFMLPTSPMSAYHQPPSQHIEARSEELKKPVDAYSSLPDESQSPRLNENASAHSFEESKHNKSSSSSSDTESQPQGVYGDMDIYQDDVVIQNPFEKEDAAAIRKNSPTAPLLTTKSQKSLPDFNEAFGTTERGRFQSPPDPRLQPKQGYLDFFLPNSDLKFDDFNI